MTTLKQQSVAFLKALPGAGHISSAVIYVTMGLLVAFVVAGSRGQTPDLRETLRTLHHQPFGPAALVLIALGSVALVAWRFLQAFADLERKGTTLLGLVQRGRYLVSGVLYGGIPFLIWKMFTGEPIRSGEQWGREAASRLMLLPFGWTILVLTGIGFGIYGTVCIYRTFSGNFHHWFHCEEMSDAQKTLLFCLGRLGYFARGIILLSAGYFIVLAGWNLNPGEISGQAGVLSRLFHQPLGPYVLGIIAVGLISCGLFSLGALRFGKLPVDRLSHLADALQEKASG